MATRTKVRKGLSPEEKTLIDNLKSMIAELESLEMGEQEGQEGVAGALKAVEGMAGTVPNEEAAPIETPEMPEENEKPKVMGLMKEIPTSSDGSPGAQAKAQQRVDDIPEQDEENIEEVGKAIARMLSRRGVGKSAAADPVMALVAAVKAIADEVAVMKTAQTKLLQGMGIADQILAVEKEESVRQAAPVGATDTQRIAVEVAKALQALNQPSGLVGAQSMGDVRKDLGGVLKTFGSSGLWNLDR